MIIKTKTGFAPISVGIPTFRRGSRVLQVLDKLQACEPKPFEVFVYIDGKDSGLQKIITGRYPTVKVLTEATRVGPGGARHRCLKATSQPYFASFDDDSWPIDSDYFSKCVKILEKEKKVAVLEASIFHKNQKQPKINDSLRETCCFTGCGHIIRVTAYREVSGYVDRPWAYGLEEKDVAMQLISIGWKIKKTSAGRVFHDTSLEHHKNKEITKATIQNAVLLPWLRYPKIFWFYGILQYANTIWYSIKKGRYLGIIEGIISSPKIIWAYRNQRKPIQKKALKKYFNKKRKVEQNKKS